MGKRCEEVINGEPCPYLAVDGTCLMDESLRKEGCLGLEKVQHERKDEWMRIQRLKDLKVSPYQGKE